MTRLSNAKAGFKTLPAAGKYLEEAVEKTRKMERSQSG
jgi:hypothetical protein